MKMKELFDRGEFVVSAEVGPPKGIHVDELVEEAKTYLKDVHAVNVTDNQSSVMRLGSLAMCKVLKDAGMDPIFQLACRDRNRIALESDLVLVFSCGVGVQTISEYLDDKKVCAACDTYPVPGFQGVTPLEYKCDQCGECYLNLTGGICPITACSKSLVNGQCGGSKNGKCEVDSDMECGWERIYRRLKEIGRLDALKCPTQIHNFATDDEVK